jgi:hypothetical protein
VLAQAFALVRGPVSFVLLRLLLGLAESGALPGVWYYVSQFYPADKTTLPYSLIETGITVSQVSTQWDYCSCCGRSCDKHTFSKDAGVTHSTCLTMVPFPMGRNRHCCIPHVCQTALLVTLLLSSAHYVCKHLELIVRSLLTPCITAGIM